jgi:hypothetical protein
MASSVIERMRETIRHGYHWEKEDIASARKGGRMGPKTDSATRSLHTLAGITCVKFFPQFLPCYEMLEEGVPAFFTPHQVYC